MTLKITFEQWILLMRQGYGKWRMDRAQGFVGQCSSVRFSTDANCWYLWYINIGNDMLYVYICDDGKVKAGFWQEPMYHDFWEHEYSNKEEAERMLFPVMGIKQQ